MESLMTQINARNILRWFLKVNRLCLENKLTRLFSPPIFDSNWSWSFPGFSFYFLKTRIYSNEKCFGKHARNWYFHLIVWRRSSLTFNIYHRQKKNMNMFYCGLCCNTRDMRFLWVPDLAPSSPRLHREAAIDTWSSCV